MAYNRFSVSVFLRVIFILLTLIVLVWLWDKSNRLVTSVFFGIMVLVQSFWLVRFVSKINKDFANFLIGLKESDNVHGELPERLKYQLSDVSNTLCTCTSFSYVLNPVKRRQVDRLDNPHVIERDVQVGPGQRL